MIGKLTDSQREVFSALMDLLMMEGRTPTVREIRAKLGRSSTNGVLEQLTRLRHRHGLITVDEGKSRGLTVTPKGWALWADVLSERAGRTVSEAEARIVTRVWKDLRELGRGPSLSGLLDLAAHLDQLPEPAATATP